MENFEILCVTMHQNDFSKIKEMNIKSNVVFANQCDKTSYEEYEVDGKIAKMISTCTRGVGINRNIALQYASAKYCLFADDDMIYIDGYENIVVDAFKKYPRADIIVFKLDHLNSFTPIRKEGSRVKRVRVWNSMRYGTPRVAIKKSSMDKACLSFSTLFGGGAKYSSGEDSLFIRDAIRKGLKIYYCPIVIAKVKQEQSSWFKGYNDKYFIDKGVLIANAFPKMKWILKYYFAFRYRKVSKDYNFRKICELINKGLKEYKRF